MVLKQKKPYTYHVKKKTALKLSLYLILKTVTCFSVLL